MLFTSNKMTCKEKMIKLNALLLLISPKNNVIKCLNFGHIIWVLIVQLWGGVKRRSSELFPLWRCSILRMKRSGAPSNRRGSGDDISPVQLATSTKRLSWIHCKQGRRHGFESGGTILRAERTK